MTTLYTNRKVSGEAGKLVIQKPVGTTSVVKLLNRGVGLGMRCGS